MAEKKIYVHVRNLQLDNELKEATPLRAIILKEPDKEELRCHGVRILQDGKVVAEIFQNRNDNPPNAYVATECDVEPIFIEAGKKTDEPE
jgi:hypothetical protein